MNYDEILSEADFETFLAAYDYDASESELKIDWGDLYRYDPDVADAAIAVDGMTRAALREATDAETVRITNLPASDAGEFVFEDGKATTCPDCRGDLGYQNRVVVLCRDCNTQFDHFYSTVKHELCTTNDDGTTLETVATAPVDSDAELVTDGGTEHKHDVGDVLEKVDSSEWKVTNRMIDVDTDEVLYRLREVHSASSFTETEILTESQIARSFETEGSSQ